MVLRPLHGPLILFGRPLLFRIVCTVCSATSAPSAVTTTICPSSQESCRRSSNSTATCSGALTAWPGPRACEQGHIDRLLLLRGWALDSGVSAYSMVVGRRPPQQATTAAAVEFRKIVNQDDLSTASIDPVRSGSSPASLRRSTLSPRPSIVWPRFKECCIRPRKTPACRLAGTRPSQTTKSAPAIKALRGTLAVGLLTRRRAPAPAGRRSLGRGLANRPRASRRAPRIRERGG